MLSVANEPFMLSVFMLNVDVLIVVALLRKHNINTSKVDPPFNFAPLSSFAANFANANGP
jgi:hypothetical protein